MMHRALAENGSDELDYPQGDCENSPSGEVAFLMTDIEGSTRLWDNAPDSMRHALQRHDDILEAAIESAGGYTFCRAGDSFAAAFSDAVAALAAAVDSQRSLRAQQWPEGAEVRVRMAIHVGEADERDGNYFGPCLNRCSRLLGVCSGGAIALSGPAKDQIGIEWEASGEFTDVGLHGLEDLNEPEHVFYCDVGEAGDRPEEDVTRTMTHML